MDPTPSGAPPTPTVPPDVALAHPIAGWSNRVTFHDVCRECGRRITGFVCDSGRLTHLRDGRWTVEIQWQHDGEGAVRCDVAPTARGQWARSADPGPTGVPAPSEGGSQP